jgi:hypothetical protein
MQATSSIQGTFGGGASDTLIHPLVAVATVVAIVCMLKLPRKYVIVPFLLAVFLSPAGQQLYVGGVHLYVPRILVFFGIVLLVLGKLKSRARLFPGGWNNIDSIFTWWTIFRSIAVTIYYWGNTSAAINQVAFVWDTLGGYCFLRFLIRDVEDIELAVKTFAMIAAFLGITMLNERMRLQNVFGYLGGVPIVPAIRDGKIRAQGPFEHPILAGTFAATLLPFFLWLWHSKRSKLMAVIGAGGCTVMVSCSASSTPLLAYMSVFIGVCFWPLRGYMRIVRWILMITLIVCHLSMKAPVWFLIAHVDLVAGNSGYHRAMLIDSFIRHFSDWWLVGTNKAVTWGYEMDDLCEQWVAEGETGGLATLICFILLISRSFGRIGKARTRLSKDRKQEWLLWFTGVALFSHCVGFFGISYFDQTRFAWFALLSIISASTAPEFAAIRTRARSTDESQLDREKRTAVAVPAAALTGGLRFRESTLRHLCYRVRQESRKGMLA